MGSASLFLQEYTLTRQRRGAFHFSQAVLPYLLKATSQTSPHPPTLIFTGATASVKGSPLFSAFASAKFAQRGLVQSLAREFAPRGVHISHVIIDGIIDLPGTKDYLNDAGPHAKLDVDGVSASLPCQTCFSAHKISDRRNLLESSCSTSVYYHT